MTNEERWRNEASEEFKKECRYTSNEPLVFERLRLWYKYGYVAGRSKGQKEIDRLRQALEDIVDPIGEIKRLLEPGERINGFIAIKLSNDPYHLKKIAKDALMETK